MVELKYYLQDGAGHQARATLMHLQAISEIESSWDDVYKCYKARIFVSRWENGREQGYVAMIRDKSGCQLNIAWFEYRNTDSLCATIWEENTINSPAIETANFGEDKGNYSIYSVNYGEYIKMAEWIAKKMRNHYEKTDNKKSVSAS